MCAERFTHDGVDDQARNDGAIRIGANHAGWHDLFHHGDDALRGEGRLLLTTEEAPHLYVPVGVGALRMDDRDVGVERRNGVDLFATERTLHGTNQRVHLRQVALGVAAQWVERETVRTGHVATDHAVVAVLLDLKERLTGCKRRRFRASANRVQRADTRVAEPAEDQLRGAPCGNHLVVDQIGRHARQRQVAALLSNDLVPCGKRDAVRESFDGHRIAVVHMRGDRRAHVHKL